MCAYRDAVSYTNGAARYGKGVAGYYYVDLMDHYMISYLLLSIALVECVSVGWIFRVRENCVRAGTASVLAALFSYLLGALLFVGLVVRLPTSCTCATKVLSY